MYDGFSLYVSYLKKRLQIDSMVLTLNYSNIDTRLKCMLSQEKEKKEIIKVLANMDKFIVIRNGKERICSS